MVATRITKRVWVGDIDDAENDVWLREKKITHVVSVGSVPTSLDESVKHLVIEIEDGVTDPIDHYFPVTNQWITDALVADGRVLIHCSDGNSRSPTILCSFMISVGWNLRDALKHIQTQRPSVRINSGFMTRLVVQSAEQWLKQFGL